MFATLRRTWPMHDGSILAVSENQRDVSPGRYELERIPNPYGFPGNWLVLKGTRIGMSERFWRSWPVISENPDDDDPFVILIEE